MEPRGNLDIMGNISSVLKELNISPSKARGQNFLNSADATRLIESSNLSPNLPVVEIGPGLGVMTEVLLRRGFQVYAVEIEQKFVDHLKKIFSSFGERCRIIKSDFRELNLLSICSNKCQVVSNVPYVFSSEMILWLLENREHISKSSLLLQREFSERIAGVPKTKQYGSLSIHVQAFAEVSMGLVLQGSVFHPPATVESRQLFLKFYENNSPFEIADERSLEKVVRASFAMRRKKLSTCLEKAGLVSSKSQAEEILLGMNFTLNVRAEELSVGDFVNLTRLLI